MLGFVSWRCGSFAKSALPLDVREGATAQLLEPVSPGAEMDEPLPTFCMRRLASASSALRPTRFAVAGSADAWRALDCEGGNGNAGGGAFPAGSVKASKTGRPENISGASAGLNAGSSSPSESSLPLLLLRSSST